MTRTERGVRVRFAPSPTGHLHVGGARTAIFNQLFARKHEGSLVLRVEDTDRARSLPEHVEEILSSLRWIGVDWDEGPLFQSKRSDLYSASAAKLLDLGAAYPCFCSPETLAEKRRLAEKAKGRYGYDGTCRRLPSDERQRRLAEGDPHVLRLRVPEGETSFPDLVQGTVAIKNETIEDFILTRSDGSPTYHLTVVADDLDLEITHVLRGGDHLSNTPKQILLYKALDAPIPAFGHFPLILGPDRKKLSKRHGHTSVSAYRQEGILPEALYNFLLLLGWSPGDDREVMSRDEILAGFSLESVSRANAVFDTKKLAWMNAEYLNRLPDDRLLPLVVSELESSSADLSGLLASLLLDDQREWLSGVVRAIRSRAHSVGEIAAFVLPFVTEDFPMNPKAARKRLAVPGLADWMKRLGAAFQSLAEWNTETVEESVRAVAGKLEIKAAILIHALRLALTGQGKGPSLFEVAALAGKERTLERIDRLVQGLETGTLPPADASPA